MAYTEASVDPVLQAILYYDNNPVCGTQIKTIEFPAEKEEQSRLADIEVKHDH